jgi:uncharacterized protein YeaO (DUF488 family)
MQIAIKRVYEPPAPEDGFRILVDRLWPRGLTKEKAKIDLWLKAVAPSTELRKWYQHDAEKWPEFKQRYFAELDANRAELHALIDQLQTQDVTLLYSSKASQYNNAVALREYILALLEESSV